jgi:aminoglycoside/choline kinase family phosphotransferase
MNEKQKNLKLLFEQWSGEQCEKYIPLPQSGSYREYYRIQSKNKSAIGVFNDDKKENIAFLTFSKHFYSHKLPVPKIYLEELDKDIYLEEDLGDETLFSSLTQKREGEDFPNSIVDVYKNVLEELPKFQILVSKDLNYEVCYPRPAFDKQSMMWDLNYFKYYFLKLAKIPFDEQLLEHDFHTFTDYLLQTDCDYFLYRDFQSRNIMLVDNKPYFIDYQGGRKGALHYDLASLLFDAKADIPQSVRLDLLNFYISKAKKYIGINENEFIQHFYGYVLIRIMQAMGAYGFRGFYEKKEHFLKSIPYALENLNLILHTVKFPIEIKTLISILEKLVHSKELQKIGEPKKSLFTLTVSVNSFSYKKGIPQDTSGNGGGFVFDCRAIHNPGRYEKYVDLTGRDEQVIKFINEETEMNKFLENVFSLVDQTVEVYLRRKFTNLMVSFGCTGGQHRSVYAAETLAKHLQKKYKVKINLKHISLDEMGL